MREAGKEVEAATDSRVKFKWYPGGVMGDDKAVLRKMRVGQLQGAALAMGELVSFYPDSQAYGVPFLFRNYDEVDYVRSQLDASLLEGFSEGGIEVLGIAEGGFGYFLTAEPVRVPSDLQQQKVWVPQNDVVSARLAQSIGVTPIPLTLPDVLPGLQTGLINTVAVSPMGAIVLQWHTRVSHITDIPLMYFCGVMSLTGKSFNKLSADDQAVVKAVFGEAFKLIDERNRVDNVKAFEALKNQGVETVVLTDAERDAWLAMQAPGEQMMQSEVSSLRRRLSASRAWSRRFASRNDPLARLNRLISRLEDSLLIGLVASLLLLAVAQIVLRNAFGEGILWAEPAMRIAVLWIAMIGGMVACREGGHIKINLFEVYAQGRARRVLAGLAHWGLPDCAALAYASWLFVGYERMDGMTTFLNLPAWWFESILPVGFTVMALRFLKDAVMGERALDEAP